MNIELTIARVETTKKPKSGKEKSNIFKSLKKESIDLEELFSFYTSSNSYTVAPGVFKNNEVYKVNWISQELAFIDCDGTMSVKEAMECCKNYGIMPNIIYYTYGSSGLVEKFRLIFVFDRTIYDRKMMEKILKAFSHIFEDKCDQSALNISNYFFGGYSGQLLTEEKTDVDVIINAFNVSKHYDDGGKVRGCIEVKPDAEYKVFKARDEDWDLLYDNCDIYRRFVDGEWLYHYELVGVAMNMQIIEGGCLKYKKIFNEHRGKHSSYSDKKENMVDYFKKNKYKAQPLSMFSNTENDMQYTRFVDVIIKNRDTKYNIVKKIDNDDYADNCIEIEEAEQIFEIEMKKAQESEENSIYIFNIPTGFGKTKFLKSLTNAYSCFYNHRVIDEITEGRDKNTYYRTYPVPKFRDKKIEDRIKLLYNQRRFKKAREIIEKNEDLCVEKQAFLNYKKNESTTFLSDKPCYTTIHREANKHNPYFSTVYFDEDPINEIVKIESIDIKDLKKLNDKLRRNNIKKLSKVIERIINSKTSKVFETEKINFELDMIEEYIEGMNFDIYSLLNSCAYFIEEDKRTGKDSIYFINHNKLEDDCKYIIMSATPYVEYYKSIYGDRVKVVDLSSIKHKGQIYQYANRSYSKQSLNNKVIYSLNEKIGNMSVVTYKELKDKFQNPASCHFGNLLGSNELNNQEMAVVGINRFRNPYYILFAYIMGIEVENGYGMDNLLVEYNGYKFKFFTFIDENLRKVYLDITNNEIIQAVGRGRTLRDDNIVHLYSGFPMRGVILEN